MGWPDNELQPVERYLFQGDTVRIGLFDCHCDDESFPVTESTADNMFVLETRSLWLRRETVDFQYLGPGSVLFHPAGCTLERSAARGGRDTAYWFAISPDVFQEALSQSGYGGYVPEYAIESTPSMHLEFGSLFKRIQDRPGDSLEIESRVLSLLDSVCEAMRDVDNPGRDTVTGVPSKARARRQVDRAKAYINENLFGDSDLTDIARAAGVSTYHLCRVFKSICGLTVHEYKTHQRLVHVYASLADGAKASLTQLALETGFSSHSHLTRTFSRRYGASPSSLRRLASSRELTGWAPGNWRQSLDSISRPA